MTAGARTSRLGGSHRWPSEPLPHTVVWHYIAGLLAGLALIRAEIGKRLSRRGPPVRPQPAPPPRSRAGQGHRLDHRADRGAAGTAVTTGEFRPGCRPCPDLIGWRIRGEVQQSITSRQARSYMAGVCKTVGSAYVGSNPTPATRFRRSEPMTLDCGHRLFGVKGADHQTVGCGPWAMRGPDPVVSSSRYQSRRKPSELRKELAYGVAGCPGPGRAWQEFVGQGWAVDGGPRTYSGQGPGGADGARNRSLSRIAADGSRRFLPRGRLRSAG